MKVAVVGARGQFGTEVVRAAAAAGLETASIDHDRCEVTDFASVNAAIAAVAPVDVVVNTAAYHRVDECEAHPSEAVDVNVRGAHHVAEAARGVGASVVYVSTDYVFDGTKGEAYVESDEPAPLNVYGATKAAAEAVTKLVNSRAYVVRISAVFGPAGSRGKGSNFVETMFAKARARETPQVVSDLVMSPTSAADAAGLLAALLVGGAPFGVYHLANAGSCSWFEFATAIFELAAAGAGPKPVSFMEQPGRARRPRNSSLASGRLGELGLRARPWRDALADYLAARGHGR